MLNVYPKLKYMKILGEKIDSRSELSIVRKDLKDFNKKATDIDSQLYNKESYGIIIEKERAEIYCDSDRAFNYGVLTLRQLKKEDKLYCSIIFDYPHMKIRGIIEGFYGEPWTFEQRCEAIATISKYKMNTYVYAPKNDLYHRIKWSQLYPKDNIKKMEELVNYCKNNYIDFYYTLGPGVSMKYSDGEQLKLLINKYMQLYEIGVRNFGVLFDDIPLELVDDEEKKVFITADKAHSYVVNKVYNYFKALDKECRLTVCGSLYNGKGDEEYIVNLGKSIPSDVEIFWTGRSICSQELDSRDAVYFLENTMHKPLYWDNYPVNDAEMIHEMHLGPIRGRDGDLYKNAEGLLCNVMEYKEASMIPVITAADYLWNCIGYEEVKSWNRGILEVVGEKDAKDFISFNMFCLKSCLNQKGNEDFYQRLMRFQYMQREGKLEEALEELLLYFEKNLKSSKVLKSGMENKELLKDISRWLNKFNSFNKLWIRCIRGGKEYMYGRKLRAILIFIPIPLQYWCFIANQISMMDFETKVLMDSMFNIIENNAN